MSVFLPIISNLHYETFCCPQRPNCRLPIDTGVLKGRDACNSVAPPFFYDNFSSQLWKGHALIDLKKPDTVAYSHKLHEILTSMSSPTHQTGHVGTKK